MKNEDIDHDYWRKKMTGSFKSPCEQCGLQVPIHQRLLVSGAGFSPKRLQYMKDLCIDCAYDTCTSWKAGVAPKEVCDSAVRRATEVKKYTR